MRGDVPNYTAKVFTIGSAEGEKIPVLEDDTPETLHARIQVQEHIAFPEALRYLAAGRLSVEGRRVHIG